MHILLQTRIDRLAVLIARMEAAVMVLSTPQSSSTPDVPARAGGA
jgi:hypothetical protein